MAFLEEIQSNWRAIVAEFSGTTLLVFAGTTVDAYGDVALRFGLTLAVLAMAIGPVSGAHYNPAVSMAALICTRIDWMLCIFYVLAQLCGGIAGAGLAQSMGGTAMTLPPKGDEDDHLLSALIMEILITLVLVLVFLGASDPGRKDCIKDLAGLAVGLALATGHWVGLTFSGASMNPFRSLGSALIRNDWTDLWVYIAGPLSGAAISAILYRFVFADGQGGKPAE